MLILLIGIALVLFSFYKWARLNENYWIARNVKSLKPYFLVGNTGGFWLNRYTINDFVIMMYNKFPNEKIFGLFDVRTPVMFVRDPEIVKQLAVKDFDYFTDHQAFINEQTDDLFGNSLFFMTGDKWRDMRATLSPAFTGSKMRQMFELVGDTAYDMSEYFRKKTINEPVSGMAGLDVEMKELFSKYTNDVIASAAFGIKVNSFENSENDFIVSGKKLMDFTSLKAMLKLISCRASPKLMQMLGVQFSDGNASRFFKSMVLDTIDYRIKEKIFRPDMINIMMQLKMGNATDSDESAVAPATSDGFATVDESSVGKAKVTRRWNDNEIVAQCFLFFAAGFDSTSTVLMFVAYELARNPDVQERLYAEVEEMNTKLAGKRLPYDELQKMRYLDAVISETLRMWPAAPQTDRECVKDYNYSDGTNKFRMEKGSIFWIPIYAFHHDPAYFPNPSKFDPDRFSDENKDNIVAGTYLPFGVGPRNCIGSRFALMEVKAVVYYLMLNFKFVPNKDTQIPIQLVKTVASVKAERGVDLRLVPRF